MNNFCQSWHVMILWRVQAAGCAVGACTCPVIASQVHQFFMLGFLRAVHVQVDGIRPMRGMRLCIRHHVLRASTPNSAVLLSAC